MEWNDRMQFKWTDKGPHSTVPTHTPQLLPTSVGVLGTRERTRAGYWSISRILSVNFQAAKILHSVLTSVDPSNSTEILYTRLQRTKQFLSRVGWETLGRWSDKEEEKWEWKRLLSCHCSLFVICSYYTLALQVSLSNWRPALCKALGIKSRLRFGPCPQNHLNYVSNFSLHDSLHSGWEMLPAGDNYNDDINDDDNKKYSCPQV